MGSEPMTGKIEHVSIGWTVDTDDGPQKTLIDLPTMRKHCRPERIADLLDDLQVLCEDVQDARDAGEPGQLRVVR
jgi:hypothetical protein